MCEDGDHGMATIRKLDRPGDLGWVVMAHGEMYAEEFGWDVGFESLVARVVADYAADHDPAREAGWIAEVDGRRVGCVVCVDTGEREGPPTAKLRLLLLHPDGRGQGLGGRLVDTCVDFARAVGYARMTLWTTHLQVAARRVYLDRGFHLVDEEPHPGFGAGVTSQTYELDLADPPVSGGAHAGAAVLDHEGGLPDDR